jgi:outer membrane lipoprotein-sorting protein
MYQPISIMKKLFSLVAFIVFAAVAVAQTPQEIISRMEAELDKHEKNGVVTDIDIKVPILGTMTSKTYSLGDKARLEAETYGVTIVTWTDNKTSWTYNSKKNEVEIKNFDGNESEPEGDIEMFSGITDDYDVTIGNETNSEWHLLCKKSKSNKDAPKKMDLVIAKKTYMPVSLRTKVSGVNTQHFFWYDRETSDF